VRRERVGAAGAGRKHAPAAHVPPRAFRLESFVRAERGLRHRPATQPLDVTVPAESAYARFRAQAA
jgi:hypothetical protein